MLNKICLWTLFFFVVLQVLPALAIGTGDIQQDAPGTTPAEALHNKLISYGSQESRE